MSWPVPDRSWSISSFPVYRTGDLTVIVNYESSIAIDADADVNLKDTFDISSGEQSVYLIRYDDPWQDGTVAAWISDSSNRDAISQNFVEIILDLCY